MEKGSGHQDKLYNANSEYIPNIQNLNSGQSGRYTMQLCIKITKVFFGTAATLFLSVYVRAYVGVINTLPQVTKHFKIRSCSHKSILQKVTQIAHLPSSTDITHIFVKPWTAYCVVLLRICLRSCIVQRSAHLVFNHKVKS